MKIAYLNALFARNIIDGRAMMSVAALLYCIDPDSVD